MNADVQQLLRLLGCPVVLAPSEAEASCAALVRAGKVYATATEDMDALTFGRCAMYHFPCRHHASRATSSAERFAKTC